MSGGLSRLSAFADGAVAIGRTPDERPPVHAGAVRPSGFLHREADGVYSPLGDHWLRPGDPDHGALLRLLERGELEEDVELDPPTRERLLTGGFLVPAGADETTRFRLKYVSLEAHTLCNQSCYFCPVSVSPRAGYFMPTEQYAGIVEQLAEFRATIEAVFMINYNEPTLDRRYVDQVRTLKEAGLPPATNTNATGLTPERVDALIALGGLRYLSVNLSTLDPERYGRDRGKPQLDLVLRHLDYARERPVAQQMDIAVLGVGDAQHRADFEQIEERFRGSRFEVKYFEVMDRAGHVDVGLTAAIPGRLSGCDNLGSRPLQHVHITPEARVVLCCEDYDERYVVGDLGRQTLRQILSSPEMARLRRWVYGLEEAPDDFICRRCIFARHCNGR